jgi:hypothetical protein
MQKVAAVFVGIVLAVFVGVVGVALVSYGPLVEAAGEADARWGDLWRAARARNEAARLLAGAREDGGAEVLAVAGRAEEAAGREKVGPLRAGEVAAWKEAQAELSRVVGGAAGRVAKGFSGGGKQGQGGSLTLRSGGGEIEAFRQATDRMAAAAEAYDRAAAYYNKALAAFPASLITRPMRFVPRPLLGWRELEIPAR